MGLVGKTVCANIHLLCSNNSATLIATMMFLLTSVLLCVVQLSTQLPTYVVEIPNGNSLPDPCTPPSLPATNGSGHWDLGGGGVNNQFGLDFADAGHTWTA